MGLFFRLSALPLPLTETPPDSPSAQIPPQPDDIKKGLRRWRGGAGAGNFLGKLNDYSNARAVEWMRIHYNKEGLGLAGRKFEHGSNSLSWVINRL